MKRMLLIAALVGLALVSTASARKPVKPPPPPPPPQGTLVFTPSPVHPTDYYTITGCGYPHSASLELEIESSRQDYGRYFFIQSDASGCIFMAWAGNPEYDADSYQTISVYYHGLELAEGVQQVVLWPAP